MILGYMDFPEFLAELWRELRNHLTSSFFSTQIEAKRLAQLKAYKESSGDKVESNS